MRKIDKTIIIMRFDGIQDSMFVSSSLYHDYQQIAAEKRRVQAPG
jgi:hypothetical protein